MSAQNDFPTTRQIAYSVFAAFVEVLALFKLRFTYFLAGLIAYLAWEFTPEPAAFLIGLITLALLAVDEIREVRRG